MADGEINRNGATIRIDDNGGVQVEPATGEGVEFTGPDTGGDATRDSVNTEKSYSGTAARSGTNSFGSVDQFHPQEVGAIVPHPHAVNPILTASDVTDVEGATGVADPLWYYERDAGIYHAFFEVTRDDPDTPIAHASGSTPLDLEYDQVVIDESYHLSFPQIFDWEGSRYIAVSSAGQGNHNFLLYEFDNFPTSLTQVENVSVGDGIGEYALVPWRGNWYLFSEGNNGEIYVSDTLRNPNWTLHSGTFPAPLAGRPFPRQDHLIFPVSQGGSVTFAYITDLTPDTITVVNDVPNDGYPVIPEIQHLDMTCIDPHHLDLLQLNGELLALFDGLGAEGGNWQTFVGRVAEEQRHLAEMGAVNNTTTVPSGTGSWTTMQLGGITSRYGNLGPDPSNNLINIGKPLLPAIAEFYASLRITNIAGTTPFTLRLRLNNPNGGTWVEIEKRITDTGTQDIEVSSGKTEMRTGSKRQFNVLIQQDSGGSLDILGNSEYSYIGAEIDAKF